MINGEMHAALTLLQYKLTCCNTCSTWVQLYGKTVMKLDGKMSKVSKELDQKPPHILDAFFFFEFRGDHGMVGFAT